MTDAVQGRGAARGLRRPAGAALLLLVLLLVALGLQALVATRMQVPAPLERALPPAPPLAVLQLAALGDPVALARLSSVYMHSFDVRDGYAPPDAVYLTAWLEAQLAMDPGGSYPLVAAGLVYGGQSGDREDIVARREAMWALLERAFLERPAERWRHVADLAVVLFHRFDETGRALHLAGLIREHAGDAAPAWARQLEFFFLAASDELDAARLLLGAMLTDGQISDPAELRLLQERLEEMERAALARAGQGAAE